MEGYAVPVSLDTAVALSKYFKFHGKWENVMGSQPPDGESEQPVLIYSTTSQETVRFNIGFYRYT